jgi:IS30 family transposase
MRVYFAHPQCPWERGTNENTNGLLRQCFPAGTQFQHVSRRQIKRVPAMLSDRSRKILNWHSPAHACHQLLHWDLDCTERPLRMDGLAGAGGRGVWRCQN